MKRLLERSLPLMGVIALWQPMEVSAQEYFRSLGNSRYSSGFGPVLPSEYTYEEASPYGLEPLRPGQDLTTVELAEEQEKYNFAIGPVRFSLAAGVGLEANDNIYLTEDDTESDFAVRPIVELDAVWRLSELNTLRFSLGVSYAKYFDHPNLDTDGLLISPGSELSLTFFVGSVQFTMRQRVSYQEDPTSSPQISNVATYDRWEYQGGLEMEWNINQQLDLVVGYDHYNLWAKGDFDDQDRGIDTVYVRPGYQVNPALKLGLNTSYSYINFQSSSRADGDNVMVGPFLQYQFSEFTNFYVEGGYQDLNFDGTSNFTDETLNLFGLSDDEANSVAQVLDNEDSSSWYVRFELQNRPSDFFRHRLLGSKTAEIGFNSDFYDLYHIEYSAEWQISEKWDLTPTVFYEYYESSGNDGEKANRFGAALGLRLHLSDSITVGLDYRFLFKDSNLPGFNYTQNIGLLSVYYRF